MNDALHIMSITVGRGIRIDFGQTPQLRNGKRGLSSPLVLAMCLGVDYVQGMSKDS
jgi:hypothetical protein